MEKEITTPEYYPLSLNATLNACNQKSSREPVLQLGEAEVRTALFELSKIGLVRTLAEGRVSKFEHRVRDGLGSGAGLRRDEVAVICLLLLRGPQTPAELRGRAERMYSFDDNAAVLTTLERLAARAEPLSVLLSRQAGSREARWAHLLCGAVVDAPQPQAREEPASDRVALLEARLRELEERVRLLEDGATG